MEQLFFCNFEEGIFYDANSKHFSQFIDSFTCRSASLNSCGTAGKTVYGGHSAIIEPFGKTLVLAGENEEILTAECDLQILSDIRGSIPVFRDRRPELY